MYICNVHIGLTIKPTALYYKHRQLGPPGRQQHYHGFEPKATSGWRALRQLACTTPLSAPPSGDFHELRALFSSPDKDHSIVESLLGTPCFQSSAADRLRQILLQAGAWRRGGCFGRHASQLRARAEGRPSNTAVPRAPLRWTSRS